MMDCKDKLEVNGISQKFTDAYGYKKQKHFK